MKISRILLIALILLLPSLGRADQGFSCLSDVSPEKAQGILAKVEESYKRISDLSASFVQESFFLGLGQRKSSTGEVYFKKPGMMDWRYESPETQRFIADGSTLWFYQPDLNQVTVGEFKDSFQTELPVSFLLGIGKLTENFKLANACNSLDGVILSLEPVTPDETLQEFYLLVSKQDSQPLGARVIDVGGNETAIKLEKLKLNKGVDIERFSFEIPRGVDVIDRRGSADARFERELSVIKEQDVGR